jgi:ligand-binding sensor domain-containing protein
MQMKYRLLSIVLLMSYLAQAQIPPIGQWRVHIPYKNPIALADAGSEVYVANSLSVYSYNKEDQSIQRLSKVSGLSEIGVRDIFYDPANNIILIAYANSNIDLLSTNQIVNFPFIRDENIIGDKNIYDVAFRSDSAFMATGFGVVVLDMIKKQSPATYFFTNTSGTPIRANAIAVFDNKLYAATEDGLFTGSLDNPLLENFNDWELESNGLPPTEISLVEAFNNRLYAQSGDTIYEFDGTGWIPFFFEEGWSTSYMKASGGELTLTQRTGEGEVPDNARILSVHSDGISIFYEDETYIEAPLQAVVDSAGTLWSADLLRGLVEFRDEVYREINPNGPASSKVLDMVVHNGTLWVAPGELSGSYTAVGNRDGFFEYINDFWIWHSRFSIAALDSVRDIIRVAINPATGNPWFGSFNSGALQFENGQLNIYKQNSSLQGAVGDENAYRVAGLAFDLNGNLWLSNHGASAPISVRTPEGTWQAIDPGLSGTGNQIGPIIVDDFNQKWFILPRDRGILVYDEGDDVLNPADDRSRELGLGVGNGNLPTEEVNCLAKDKQGEIWVGTTEGITVFFNPFEALNGGPAGDANQIFVELDGFGGFLLEEEIVNTIFVDGANRKWIGTENGAFLVSDDGTEQLAYFNEDNSPLLSNRVLNITADPESGEVFFGTDQGIISYRGEATDGSTVHQNVNVFPNPVTEDYEGPIAIKGLVENAEVKITDASGVMIYQTNALGGQAIWDGRNYEGERAKTGVYLVFSSNEDGSETYVTKLLIIN